MTLLANDRVASWIHKARKFEAPARAVAICAGYATFILVFRLLILTFITYFLLSSASNHSPKFEEVYETFGSNELGIMGIGALLFVTVLPRFNPLGQFRVKNLFGQARLEKQFLPGFAQGAVLAAALVLAFLFAGVYRYLGFFVQIEDTPLAILNVLLRTFSLGSLIYFEEYLFREKLLGHFLRWKKADSLAEQWLIAALLSVLYTGIKAIQFDLGLMHWITLFLLSMSLSLRAMEKREFAEGAGFWLALLLLFHPLLSLPIFGNDFSGLVLIKYQPGGVDLPPGAVDTASSTVRLFTGGSGGPVSSFALQLLITFGILREAWLRYRSTALRSSA